MKDKIKKERKSSSKNDKPEFSLFKVETNIDDSNPSDKYISFIAAPNFMKDRIKDEPSLLTSSVNCKSLYKVPSNKYNESPEEHDDKAYERFGTFLDFKAEAVKSR